MKIYIAGPFFNDLERRSLEEMIILVRDNFPDAELFIPMEHFISNGEDLPNEIWARKVFEMDVASIDTVDMMIAMYTGHYSDTGTVWEIGYASAKKIPVIGFVPEWAQTEDMSLMVINSLVGMLDPKSGTIKYLANSIKEFNQK